ncbi:MAG: ABC transporter permease [Fluviicola sp.]|nr:ABC transporter permease [Fluviicola sp.]
MNKLLATLKKEALVVLHDKVGLLLMYVMPIALVFIITLVNDSSFRMVSGNEISVLVVNDDNGDRGDSLIRLLEKSGSFKLTVTKCLSSKAIQQSLLKDNRLLAIQIPKNFTLQLTRKASGVTDLMLNEFGVKDSVVIQPKNEPQSLVVFYDPVLQENYRFSINNSIYAYLGSLENSMIMQNLYAEMGYDNVPEEIRIKLSSERVMIEEVAASSSGKSPIPNATQHNVPAWSVFAMFFMVVSLGGNIVKERLNGTFVRLRTIPSSFSLVLYSKMLVYLVVALSQLLTIGLIGMFVFPLIDLPKLNLPENLIATLVVALLSGMTAVSYAVLVGVFSKTQEQANGFGAISIIIFAAIGGIWVPSFAMPEYLQSFGQVSPLHWCLSGFYVLFLQNGAWSELQSTVLFLGSFIVGCQLLVYLKLKAQRHW